VAVCFFFQLLDRHFPSNSEHFPGLASMRLAAFSFLVAAATVCWLCHS
jgi:hypothetical protein